MCIFPTLVLMEVQLAESRRAAPQPVLPQIGSVWGTSCQRGLLLPLLCLAGDAKQKILASNTAESAVALQLSLTACCWYDAEEAGSSHQSLAVTAARASYVTALLNLLAGHAVRLCYPERPLMTCLRPVSTKVWADNDALRGLFCHQYVTHPSLQTGRRGNSPAVSPVLIKDLLRFKMTVCHLTVLNEHTKTCAAGRLQQAERSVPLAFFPSP